MCVNDVVTYRNGLTNGAVIETSASHLTRDEHPADHIHQGFVVSDLAEERLVIPLNKGTRKHNPQATTA